MLLRRILTAVPLAVFVVWMVLEQSTSALAYLVLVVSVLAAYEWSAMCGSKSPAINIMFSIFIGIICWISTVYLSSVIIYYITVACIFWLVIAIYLMNTRPVQTKKSISYRNYLAGVIILPASYFSILEIHKLSNGAAWLLFGLCLVWLADIGAYFSGKKFGRVKLAEFISPGKTWEGIYGALIINTLFCFSATWYFQLTLFESILLLVLTVTVTFVSVVGDLFESVLKRQQGLKDSGSLLPGHGGVLDRIDGLVASMPIFFVGINYLLQDN